jgi:kynureninase
LEEAKSKNLDLDFNIITPYDSNSRGAQLSLLFEKNGRAVFDHITKNNSIVDWREPNVIRIAPAPLYNSFEDVFKLGEIFASFSKN